MGLDGVETPRQSRTGLSSQLNLISHTRDNSGSKRAEAVVSQGEDRRGNKPARVTRIRSATPRRGADMRDESATRREGGQLARHRWHTLVPCSLTTEYRPVRPPGEVWPAE